ncbi:MAG TPA: FG-GAP repeat protein [Bryobacteraceae bacterium]|nr:FG-GAP repeat protein [Bryobacteraceae bacterium]
MDKTSARGLAVGDYDNDGRSDLLVGNMNDRLSLLRNTAPAGKLLTLKLVGQKTIAAPSGYRASDGWKTNCDQ